MNPYLLTAVASCVLTTTPVMALPNDCAPENEALDFWREIKSETATQNRNELSRELVNCLASPSPELRDQIAYELFTAWLREQHLDIETRQWLLRDLSNRVDDQHSTLNRSFSALILAELMRSDNVEAFMTDTERATLLGVAIGALATESDFRGLDPELGWIHPVAHLADLLWRFALHAEVSRAQAAALLDAVYGKMSPSATVYQFNESDRLARVVTTIIARKLVSDDALLDWLQQFESPQHMASWRDAFSSPSGMRELQNTKAFIRALSDQLSRNDLNNEVREMLAALVSGFTSLI